MGASKPGSLAAEPSPMTGSKLFLIGLLSLGCGFLVFNFSHIIHISHVHISLTHHHRTAAFCAFIGCKFTEDMQGALPVGSSHKPSSPPTPVVLTPAEKAAEEKAQMELMKRILSTRVCGSPAIDGYAYVKPECLETSPTARWWNAYYAAGGKQNLLVAHIEKAADYDGLAVKWGIKNTVNSPEECAQQCLNHQVKKIPGPYTNLPCNAFAYCPEEVCFEPDAHKHAKGDCWLKFTEGPAWPEVNMRGDLPADFRKRHPTAPARVQWVTGVLLPPGLLPTNGTWGPRWFW